MAPSDLSPDLRAEIRQKKLVFTVSTGRSGTRYLSFLLSHLPNTESVHEPEPSFATVMREVQEQPEKASAFWREQKLPAIADVEAPIYVETSHLFCKGFFEPLLELGVRPALIFLRRNHRDVALSLYRLQTIPGRDEKALSYYLSPKDSSTYAPNTWASFHDYQLCYWYALEIERRERIYRKISCDYGLDMRLIYFKDLINNRVSKLTNMIGLPKISRLEKYKINLKKYIRKNKSFNKKKNKKRKGAPENINEMESEVEYYFAENISD